MDVGITTSRCKSCPFQEQFLHLTKTNSDIFRYTSYHEIIVYSSQFDIYRNIWKTGHKVSISKSKPLFKCIIIDLYPIFRKKKSNKKIFPLRHRSPI